MKTAQKLAFKNPVKIQCFGSDGNLKWEEEVFNGIVDEGIEYLLNVAFRSATTQINPWYILLVDNAGFSAFANADTMASHAGWTEFTNYSEATRPEWTAGTAAARAIANAATVDYTINGVGGEVKGVAVTSSNTKSGTVGTLWSTAAFSSNATVTSGDTLKITYTISG